VVRSSFQQVLFVAWEFGLEDHFTYAAKQIALHTSMVNNGLVCQDSPLSPDYVPQHVIDHLSSVQEHIVTGLLEFGHAKVDIFVPPSGEDATLTHFEDDFMVGTIDPEFSGPPGGYMLPEPCPTSPAQTKGKAPRRGEDEDGMMVFETIRDCPCLVLTWASGQGGLSLSQFAEYLCVRVAPAHTSLEASVNGHDMHHHIEDVLGGMFWVNPKQKLHFKILKAAYGEGDEDRQATQVERGIRPDEGSVQPQAPEQLGEMGQVVNSGTGISDEGFATGTALQDSACCLY
jgi:hypothetical protein